MFPSGSGFFGSIGFIAKQIGFGFLIDTIAQTYFLVTDSDANIVTSAYTANETLIFTTERLVFSDDTFLDFTDGVVIAAETIVTSDTNLYVKIIGNDNTVPIGNDNIVIVGVG